MKSHRLLMLASLSFLLLPAIHAQSPTPSVTLRYQFTPGQTLRYVIQRDPYFNDPVGAIETTDTDAPYKPPVVERLTEKVQTVAGDGTATIQITVAPEPGFEDEAHPQPTLTQTVRVTPLGQVLSPLVETAQGELLRAFFRLPAGPVRPGSAWNGVAVGGLVHSETGLTLTTVDSGSKGLEVITQTEPPFTTENRSRSHDGILLQTTCQTQSDQFVFDLSAGNLWRQRSTMTIALSLVMTGRGTRGAADFGRVIPTVQIVQTLTIERRDNPPPSGSTTQTLRKALPWPAVFGKSISE